MAMVCIHGGKECDGCMDCREQREILGHCDYCGEPIYEGETHYMLEDGTMLHEDCDLDWLRQYRKGI